MKRIIFSALLITSIGFAQTTEKENLKKNEEALTKVAEDRPTGWLKKE